MSSVNHSERLLHRRLRRIAVTAALSAGIGIAAGCGGGSSSTSSTTAATVTLTKTAFLAQANAICAKADPLLSEATAKLSRLRDKRQVVSIVERTYVPAIEAQVAQIRALGAPTGEQASVTAMLKVVLGDLHRLKSNPALVATDVFGDFAKVAHPYGLTACAPLS